MANASSAAAEYQHERIGQQKGDPQAAAVLDVGFAEDQCQRVFQHAKGKGTEQQQHRDTVDPDRIPRVEQRTHGLQHYLGVGRGNVARLAG